MSHSDAEIRELLRNLRKPDKLDLAYPITATEDDLVALIEELTATESPLKPVKED